MMQLLTQEELATILGRSLTEYEQTNFGLLLELAQIRLEDLTCSTLIIPLSAEVKMLLARLFAVISEENAANPAISSKKVEDFQINYSSDNVPFDNFIKLNRATLAKLNQCYSPVRSGRTRDGHDSLRYI